MQLQTNLIHCVVAIPEDSPQIPCTGSKDFCSFLSDAANDLGAKQLAAGVSSDHVHLLLSIPPRYSVAYTIGFLKGKSAVRIHRELLHERRMSGLHFWTTGYWVSTVGRDEASVRQYIRTQEDRDRQQGQLFE